MREIGHALRVGMALVILLMLASPALFNAQSSNSRPTIHSLHKVRPATTWNAASARTADVDCDSKADTIALGSEKGKVIVGVVWGAAVKKAETFAFPIGRSTQDAFCVAPKKIEVAPLDCQSDEGTLPGCKVVKGCKAFTVIDEDCDPFNFYWHAERNQLAWWRL